VHVLRPELSPWRPLVRRLGNLSTFEMSSNSVSTSSNRGILFYLHLTCDGRMVKLRSTVICLQDAVGGKLWRNGVA